MLELAREADREAVNALATQVHAMHVVWRPDIYEMPEEQYTEDRFLDAIRKRELYVAKLDDIVAGYVLLKKCIFSTPLINHLSSASTL